MCMLTLVDLSHQIWQKTIMNMKMFVPRRRAMHWVNRIGNCFVVVGRMRSAECPFSFCYNGVEFVTFAIICTGQQELS